MLVTFDHFILGSWKNPRVYCSVLYCLPQQERVFIMFIFKKKGIFWRKNDNTRSNLDISIKTQWYKSSFGFLMFPFVVFYYSHSCNHIYVVSLSILTIYLHNKNNIWMLKCKYKAHSTSTQLLMPYSAHQRTGWKYAISKVIQIY